MALKTKLIKYAVMKAYMHNVVAISVVSAAKKDRQIQSIHESISNIPENAQKQEGNNVFEITPLDMNIGTKKTRNAKDIGRGRVELELDICDLAEIGTQISFEE
jgi:hypothetical protein